MGALCTYRMDGHCQTVVGCALQEGQLQQVQHLTHYCRDWEAVHQMEHRRHRGGM